MARFSRSRARLALSGAAVLALAGTLAGVAPAAHAADPVTINLLGINDFHGRIDPNITVKWAYEIEHLRDQAVTPANGSLLVGAGDLIGASLFNSAVANDQPTIDVLNEIGLDASSVGNHEFDKGWDDLQNRVIDGGANASWDYLGANVYEKGTTTPVLPEYETYDVDGVTVGVIGAVTEETSSLVSPGGIADLDFGPIVPALNRVAGQLSDGNDANGEADVIVAVVHAGAVDGTESFEESLAHGGEFADMANNLSPQVNAVFQGHTHQAYVYDAPVTGGDLATRPMLQTGSYGSNIGQVVLSVDPDTGTVQSFTAANNAVPTTGDNSTFIDQYPDVLNPVNDTVTAAKDAADLIGNQPVGSITSDITTAFTGGTYQDGVYTGGTRDDRASESTMGDLVANALRDGLPADMGHADLGITNPGGLRNEFDYAGDTTDNPANTAGVLTYAEANNVLPFVNNIWTVDLLGSDLKQVLEQQWQPDGAQRPFLNLGLSDNVSVTLDPNQPEGSRVTSVTIDGAPLDPDETYTICTFSFLGTGGDNFTAFTEGTSHDTGLVDRDLWIDYLQDHPGIGPDFGRQEVNESGMPASVQSGEHLDFTLSNLDLTSQGSPANQTVEVYAETAGGREHLGSSPVTDGTTTVQMDVPDGIPAGSPLTVVALPSGTTVSRSATAATLATSSETMSYGKSGVVHVSVDPEEASGSVTVLEGTTSLGSAAVDAGQADVAIPRTALVPGRHLLTVSYPGDGIHRGASTAIEVKVAKSSPKVKVTRKPTKVHAGRTQARLVVTLNSPGHTVKGKVEVRTGGRTYSARLVDGTAKLTLKPYGHTGKKTVRVHYLATDLDRGARKKLTIRVVK